MVIFRQQMAFFLLPSYTWALWTKRNPKSSSRKIIVKQTCKYEPENHETYQRKDYCTWTKPPCQYSQCNERVVRCYTGFDRVTVNAGWYDCWVSAHVGHVGRLLSTEHWGTCKMLRRAPSRVYITLFEPTAAPSVQGCLGWWPCEVV